MKRELKASWFKSAIFCGIFEFKDLGIIPLALVSFKPGIGYNTQSYQNYKYHKRFLGPVYDINEAH